MIGPAPSSSIPASNLRRGGIRREEHSGSLGPDCGVGGSGPRVSMVWAGEKLIVAARASKVRAVTICQTPSLSL